MSKFSLPRLALAALALPLALSLSACGESGEAGGGSTSDKIESIAAPAGKAWADVVARTPEGGFQMGNPDAPIKLVEYGSLTCPACANFSQTGMQSLRDDYINSGRVSLEFRSVPIHGAVDLVLTRMLECGPKEAAPLLAEPRWGHLDAVLTPIQSNAAALEQAMSLPENQRFVAYADQGGLIEFFAARGFSIAQSSECLSDFAAMQALAERLQAQADKDGVNSTPTFLLNGTAIDETSWAALEPMLQNAGAR